MGKYFDMLMEDVRMKEGLTACMNCGICTGVCPAAEFYNYDPRQIINTVQTKDDDAIEQLLKSDTIWYCGECMSCRPRCPRANTPGYVIQALRRLSQQLGFFTYSEKGRQQLAIKRTMARIFSKPDTASNPIWSNPRCILNRARFGNGFMNMIGTYSNVSEKITARLELEPCVKSTIRAWRRSVRFLM